MQACEEFQIKHFQAWQNRFLNEILQTIWILLNTIGFIFHFGMNKGAWGNFLIIKMVWIW